MVTLLTTAKQSMVGTLYIEIKSKRSIPKRREFGNESAVIHWSNKNSLFEMIEEDLSHRQNTLELLLTFNVEDAQFYFLLRMTYFV